MLLDIDISVNIAFSSNNNRKYVKNAYYFSKYSSEHSM